MKIKGVKKKQERKEGWKDNKVKDNEKKKKKKNREQRVLSKEDEICECEMILRVYRSEKWPIYTYELLAFSSEVRSSSLATFRVCAGCFLGNVTSLPLP